MPDNNLYTNFTYRKDIRETDASFHVNTVNQIPVSFSTRINISDYGFDPRSNVIVEVYNKRTNSRVKFEGCGTVGHMVQLESASLDKLDTDSIVNFSVKIVREDYVIEGLIEGIRDYFTTNTGTGSGGSSDQRTSLLPVNYGAENLGQITCRLRFDDSGPVLDINNSIEDARQSLVQSPYFVATQFPGIVESVVKRAFDAIGPEDIGTGDGWEERWARFAIRLMGGDDPRQDEEIDLQNDDWYLDVAAKRLCGIDTGATETGYTAEDYGRLAKALGDKLRRLANPVPEA